MPPWPWMNRRPVAPAISPNKTWEGLIGGTASATLVGAALWWATPFAPHEAGIMAGGNKLARSQFTSGDSPPHA